MPIQATLKPERTAHNTGPPTVLVVDDDAALRRMLTLTLREYGYAVCSAADGEAALREVSLGHPDAIILDLEMPVMGGREFYRRLRGSGDDTPVIVMSAYDARPARRELGANAAIEKPFSPDALVTAVRSIV